MRTKPHIRIVVGTGQWMCYGRVYTAFGSTPYRAYRMWLWEAVGTPPDEE